MNPTTRYLVVTLIPLVAIVFVTTGWSLWLLPEVPDPMAVHFDADFAADGYLSPALNIVFISGVSVLIILGFVVLAYAGMRHGAAGRLSAGSAGFTVTLLSVLQIVLFRQQSGLSSATEANLSWALLVLCFGVAAAVGGLLAWVATPVPSPKRQPASSAASVAKESTLTVWKGSETMHIGLRVFLGAVAAMTVVFIFLIPNWVTTLTAIVTVGAVLSTWGWRLRVDSQGFSYRSFLGIPRGHIPHESIETVELIEVNAGNWGGWGWRRNTSGTGLVTHSGPGFRITRINGRVLEVSSTDAPTAVGVLKQYNPDPTHRAD